MMIAHLESTARALEALDVEDLLTQYASQFVFEDTAAGLTITDREGLRGYFERLFSIPGVAFSDVVMFEDGRGHGGGEWVWSGLDPSGRPFRVRGASIFEVAESGITRESIYYQPPGAPAGA
ncbi:MAG: SnoaL-like domain-containing protein [Acidimicrobiia bacterium]|nr:SnoaL-like domain-containing protein [Acidimicrobiia bacterium]